MRERDGERKRGSKGGEGVREGERNVERSVRDGLVKFDEANGTLRCSLPNKEGKCD